MAIEVGFRFGDGPDAIWINAREAYGKIMPVSEMVKVLRDWHVRYGIARIWCDHSQPAAVDLLNQQGLPAIANEVRDIGYGVATLYSLMRQGRWKNNPRACPHLEDELRLYSWGHDRKGQKTDKPVDRHNHGVDAVRYYLVGEGEQPPQEKMEDLLSQAVMWVGTDGKWRDNPRAAIAQGLWGTRDPDAWWDEQPEEIDDDEQANQIRQYLGMPPLSKE